MGDAATSAAVRDAHEAAVAAAVGYLEAHAGFCRRGHGGAERVAVAGFVAAAFRHRTSRAGDPLLHTHVLVANLGRAVDDGRWRTLDGRSMYVHAKTAGCLYQAQLRAELSRRLGVDWGQVRRVPDREAPAVGDGQALPDPPPHLGRVLGAIPKDASARVRWVTAAAVIDTYRERYQIDNVHIAFGSRPAEGEQRTERERAVAYTRELLQQIDRAEHDRSIAGVGWDQPPGPELGR